MINPYKSYIKIGGLLLNEKGCINEIKEKAIDYAKRNKVEKSVIMTLTGAANCKIGYNLNSKKGETNMWTVFEERWKNGRESRGNRGNWL